MLQAVLKSLGNIELEETTPRELKSGEVRLKVISCAICGSDIRIYNHGNPRVKMPHVIGHEVVGQVIEKTDGCDLTIGAYCCFGADLPCNDEDNCPSCRINDFSSCDKNYAIGHQFDGGFAEEMIIPENCWKYGSFRIINTNKIEDLYQYSLVEPLACAFHGVDEMCVNCVDDVLIFGGGPIGLMIGDLCHFIRNCKSVTIIEPAQTRRDLIQKLFPYFEVIENAKSLDKKFNIIFTANSVPECQKLAFDFAKKYARINFFGGLGTSELVSIDTNKIHYLQLCVTGTHGSRLYDFNNAFEYVETGKIDLNKYITAFYPLKEIKEAFKAASDLNNLKIVIRND